MVFNVSFIDSVETFYEGHIRGHIVAGSLDEQFEVPASHWSRRDYCESWDSELSRLVAGQGKAVIMTLVVEPSTANWLRGYELYRFDDEVRIHERMFMVDDLECAVDLKNPSRMMGEYRSETEEGLRISEWRVSIRDIQDFLDRKSLIER